MGIANRVQEVMDSRVQKFVYPAITRRIADRALFLNFGYEENPPMGVPLSEGDERYRFPIQLYHKVAAQASITGGDVLEVGCGHGGGAAYLARTFQPASYIGLDLNPKAVEFCREHHAGIGFVRGDAQELPFADASFDAVINVESSLHYPRFEQFLGEVGRVLRPGGVFLYADVRPADQVDEWEAALGRRFLVEGRDISVEVVRGMEGASADWRSVIDERLPVLLRSAARKTWGLEGSLVYLALKEGRSSYRMYRLMQRA